MAPYSRQLSTKRTEIRESQIIHSILLLENKNECNEWQLQFISDLPKDVKHMTFNVILNFQGSQNPKNHIFELTNIGPDGKSYSSSRNIVTDWFFNRILIIRVDILQTNSTYFNTLPRDLKYLLDDESYSDLKLCVKDQIFNVHRSILSCRCKILARMIKTDTLKDFNDVVESQGISSKAVKELLNYIYTSDCDFVEIAHELFKLAYFLNITELEVRCKEFIFKNIDSNNIVNVLELLDNEKYELAYLKEAVVQFVKLNEDSLIKDERFLKHVRKSIRLENIGFIIRLAFNDQSKAV
ncbi:hypothetical protein TSAR_006539 [Trichomalopsis sarcophagae]|uniref:BTB domain-containing protein n=1 Tax=Trichomalopsis sarcophagae TaxID=543379 RepID=A0A232FKK7_9HYME|nr:hypothetical protein TSAR_006539 [Trichomalopsis sarcophagae]